MERDEFLRLLEDQYIRRTIRQIARENEAPSMDETTAPSRQNEEEKPQNGGFFKEAKERFFGEKKNTSAEQNETTAEFQKKLAIYETKLQTITKALKKEQTEKSDAIRHATTVEQQAARWEQKAADLQTKCVESEKREAKLQGSVQRLQDSVRGLNSQIEMLKKTQEQEKRDWETEQKALQDQLSQRFARGWELFEIYQTVDPKIRRRLSGVFTKDDSFMSFICGGAQTSSLEALWDVLHECVQNAQGVEAEKLWDIFEYCLRLVNASKMQARYEVLAVEEGDRFDSDCHTEGPGSRAQGKIVDIYLRGYRNSYNGKVIRKSIVQVG